MELSSHPLEQRLTIDEVWEHIVKISKMKRGENEKPHDYDEERANKILPLLERCHKTIEICAIVVLLLGKNHSNSIGSKIGNEVIFEAIARAYVRKDQQDEKIIPTIRLNLQMTYYNRDVGHAIRSLIFDGFDTPSTHVRNL